MSYNPFSLAGKTILVTGASSGIGRAIAIECAKLQACVIVTGRNTERLSATFEYLKAATNLPHQQVVADLSAPDGISLLVANLPPLHGVVHCAAIIKKLPVKFINEAALTEILQTNLTVPTLLTQKILKKKLLADGASIVFISSIAARIASFGNAMYMASKGALNAMARGMALELADKKIRVNCVEPALIKTNLTTVLTQEDLDNYQKKFPLGRFGEPEEVAYATIYLLSDAAAWVTGTAMLVDGGVTLR
jgi:NAD(P)-dependent dehydrogenase (short-subunit alcohol dehydrogenase family)